MNESKVIMLRNDIFIGYSHQDKNWLNKLKIHLKHLEQQYEFSIWDDSKIDAGAVWRNEIKKATESARVVILLISAHFLSSDFIVKEELPPLLKAAKEDGAIILMLIVSACMIKDVESLNKFQFANSPDLPLNGIKNHEIDRLFVDVTEQTKRILVEHQKQSIDNDENKTINKTESNTKEIVATSIANYSVLKLLSEHFEKGLTMSELHQLSKIKNRKYIANAVYYMESVGIVMKRRIKGKIFFKLTNEGKKRFNSIVIQ